MASRIFLLFFFGLQLFFVRAQDTLRVAVYNSPPFGMETNSGRIGGLMVELWEDIADDMDVEYQYTLTDMNGLISGLESKTFDVGLGAISITPEREKRVDFTHAVNPSGTGIAISKESKSTSLINKWGPIFVDFLQLTGTLLIMLFLSAVIVFLVEKWFTKGEKTDNHISSIADGLWWSAVTMTTVGYGDKVPRTKVGKFLGIVWIFISIAFFSLFTASTSAKLANYRGSSSVNYLDDLHEVRVVAVAKSSGEEFLLRENVKYSPKETIGQAIQSVLEGEADALVSNVPVLKYHNKVNFQNRLLISDHFLLRNNMGIALQVQSPLKEQINHILLQKISEPKWQSAVYKYIGE